MERRGIETPSWLLPEDMYATYACEEDIDDIQILREDLSAWLSTKDGTDGQWTAPWPSIDEQRQGIAASVQAGETYIVRHNSGDLVATMTLDAKGEPYLWSQEQLRVPSLYLRRLMVARKYAGQDIGAGLVEWSKDIAMHAHKARLRINVHNENFRLQEFYKSLAFEGTTLRLFDYPAGALMECSINAMPWLDAEQEHVVEDDAPDMGMTAFLNQEPFAIDDLTPAMADLWRYGDWSPGPLISWFFLDGLAGGAYGSVVSNGSHSHPEHTRLFSGAFYPQVLSAYGLAQVIGYIEDTADGRKTAFVAAERPSRDKKSFQRSWDVYEHEDFASDRGVLVEGIMISQDTLGLRDDGAKIKLKGVLSRLALREGMGFAPLPCEAFDETDGPPRVMARLRMPRGRTDPDATILQLPETMHGNVAVRPLAF